MRSRNAKFKNKDFTKLAQSVTIGMILSMSIAGTGWSATPTSGNNLPSGNTNSIGKNDVATNGNTMTITQDKTVNTAQINWQTFDIGTDYFVNFKQQSSGSTMVNNVTGNNMSEIYGHINATGNVVLINPNGALFDGATVNVGGLAVYATNSMKATDFNKDITQGNITIKDSTITAGVSTAAQLAKDWNITDYAVGIASNANRIRLVADGNVNLQGSTVLQAVDTTVATGTNIEGEEEFEMEGNASVVGPQVNIRADANSDDYGTVTINSGSPKIITKEVHILYNPDLVQATIAPNENGSSVATLYNKKNYKIEKDFSALMDSTTAVKSYKVTTDTTGLYEKATKVENTADHGIATADARMLVNNIAQLQDIEDGTYGSLSGKYALGKDIDATSDTASYILGKTVLFRGNTNGKISATSTVDGGVYANTGENITKSVGGYTISYTTADTKASATVSGVTYGYNGTEYTKNGETILDYADWPTGLTTYLATAQGEFRAVATTAFVNIGENITHINSALWGDAAVEDTTARKGFNPIGDDGTGVGATGAFTGSFDGFGGDATHTISNLTINLGGTDGTNGQDNVGLFGVVSGGSLIRTNLSKAKIVGQNNVGGLAGQITNGASISWSHNSGNGGINATVAAPGEGYVKVSGTETRTNIGGLVGLSDGSTISNSGNTATIIGRTADDAANVSRVGGIAGSMVNTSKAENIANAGNVFGESETGGLIGYGESSQIGVNNTIDNLTAASFNRGQVDGIEDTGGIAGHIKDVKLHGVYNTNEDAALGVNSQYYIDVNGKIVKQGVKQDGSADETLKNKNITSADALSKYGQVTGKDYTGGIVGLMEDSSSDNSKSEINTAYNAGNITGTGDSTGGIVGKMTGGKVSDAYNGDNNTVIREALPTGIKQAVKNDLIITLNSTTYTFKYNATEAEYYSFYTVVDGSKKYYFFKSVGDTTTKGAGGIFVDEDGNYVPTLPDESTRYYLNRVGYKDANVTGGTTNTGGIIGNMTGGSADTTYNLGSVTGTAATTGALVGALGADAAISNSFFVSGTDASIGKAYSKATTAIGIKAGTEGTVKDYTLGDARDRTTLHTDFGDSFVGQIVNTESGTGYSLYKSGGIQYYFDDTENIYTKSGDTYTAQYTKSTEAGHEGKYKGLDGYYYTYAATADGSNFTLTPVTDGEWATVTFTGDLVASNQSDTWLAYEEQTAPLLKYFMNTSNIDRVFAYDGTTHNLKTDDVDNLYGRADFNPGSGAGQKVHSADYANSTKYDGSSEYYYDNSTIWSPQHGYKMNPKASVIITPVALEITLSGNKTYGDINNLKGYYISVPYYDKDTSGKNTGDPHYAFYEVKKVADAWTYELLTGTALTDFFEGYTQNQDGIQKKADHDCKYLVTMNGIINTEATKIDAAVKGFVAAVGGETSATGDNFTGAVWDKNGTKTTDTQQLNAGSYGFTTTEGAAILTGVTAQNNDYKITYDGNLKINKADLYYTYKGEREYGDANSTGSKTYTLVGTDVNSTTKSVDGLLKSFDKDKITDSPVVKNTDGTWTMTGTVATGNVNITDNGTKSITQGSTGDSYYEVMVGSDGKPLGYVLKTLDSGTMKLVGATDANTTELNNNYNLVWHVGGTNVTVNSTEAGKTGIQTATIDVNDSTQKITPVTLTVNVSGTRYYGDKMNAKGVTGGGNAWNKNYNVTVADGTLKNGETLLGGDVLYTTTSTITGAEKVNDVLAKIDKDYTTTATKQIDERTNAATYDVKDYKENEDTHTNSHITLTKSAANHNYIILDGTDKLTIAKKNVTVTATAERTYGEDNSAITNKKLTESGLTSWDSGTGSNYANNQSTWQSDINVTNASINKSTDAGTYGTNGTTNKTQALGYGTSDADKAGIRTALGDNYNVTFKDKLTINKKKVTSVTVTITGNREYGELMKDTNWTATDGWTASAGEDAKSTGETAAGRWNVAVTGAGVEEWDKDRIDGTNISGLNSGGTKNYDLVFNSSAVTTMLGTIEDEQNHAATTTGSHITYNTNASTTDYNIHSGTTYTGSNVDLTSTAYTNSLLKNYVIETNGNHALKINPKKITVTVNGERDYGSNMNTGSGDYTVTTAIPADNKLTSNKINITVDGWSSNADGALSKTNGIKDTATAASTLVNAIEGTYGGNKISDHTNVGTYKLDGTATGYADSKITDDILAGIIDTKNGNYEIINNTTGHSLKIDPKAVTLTATAEKEYGNDNTLANKSLTQSGLTSWDSAAGSTYANNQSMWQNSISVTNANIDKSTYAGTYGTNGTTNKTQALGYGTNDADKAGIENALGTNYTVTYKDLLTIKKAKLTLNTTGSKTYGNEATSANIEHITGTGFKNTDADILTDTLSSTFKGYVDNKKAAATINAGTYTSTDGSVLVYDAADRTNIEQAFNNNYDIDYTDSFVVNKAELTLNTTGSKTYGDEATAANLKDITGTGFKNTDADILANNQAVFKGYVDNKKAAATINAGTYASTDGSVLVYDAADRTNIEDAFNKNYTIKYTDSFVVNKAELTLNTTGSKTYGDEATAANLKDITGIGFKNTDADILANNQAVFKGYVDNKKAAATINAGTYASTDGSVLVYDAADRTNIEDAFNKNYTIKYTDSFVVNKAELTLNTTGSKTYGDEATAANLKDITGTGFKNTDADILANNQAVFKGYVDNKKAAATINAGTYASTDGSVLVYDAADRTNIEDAFNKNYTIKYVDKFDINKRKITVTQTGTKEYGTGSEHSTYSEVGLDNVANGQEAAIKAATNTKDSSTRTTNVGSYKNTEGKDNGLLTVGISGIDDIMKNYDVTYNTTMNVTPADFTYTSDHTEYWQGTPIPAQTGKVTNRFGEDVSDLVGKTTWDTPADTYTPGIYPIWGHGANDFTGNYNPLQSTNPNNAKALKIKNRPADRHTDEVQAFGLVRRPMLDIRYLELVGTEGVNRWISTNDLGTKSTTTLYDKKKTVKYQF